MSDTVGAAIYVALGVVWLVAVLPKYREVFSLARQPEPEMFDQVVLGAVSVLTVIAWPLVAVVWALKVLGTFLAGSR